MSTLGRWAGLLTGKRPLPAEPIRSVEDVWVMKQGAAAPGRYYGDGGTIHSTGFLDVEVHEGVVVSVWFRCQVLPFRQVEVDHERMLDMKTQIVPLLTGVEVLDP